MSIGLPVLRVVIFPWTSTGLWHSPPPLFGLFSYYHLLYWFLLILCLILHLLPLSLVPPLYSTIESSVSWPCRWCFYYAMALAHNFPFLWFVLDYPFIAQILSLLPPTLLMWVFSCVSLSHRLEFLLLNSFSLKLHWPPHSPPSNHLQLPHWLTPYYWDFSPLTLFCI
jgi:hypothetical protein